MFVTNAPGVACALALELIEACTPRAAPEAARRPRVRRGDRAPGRLLRPDRQPRGAARRVGRARHRARRRRAARPARARPRRLRLRRPPASSSSRASTSPSRSSNSSADRREHRADRVGSGVELQGAICQGREVDACLRTARPGGRGGRRPSRGRVRRRARCVTGPASASVRNTRTTSPPGVAEHRRDLGAVDAQRRAASRRASASPCRSRAPARTARGTRRRRA